MPDLTAADMDAAVRTIAGTARSMGIEVEGTEMARLSKRMRAIPREDRGPSVWHRRGSFTLLKELEDSRKFEGFDVAINLGVDPRKSDQVVRGSTTLPHGTGKDVRVAVFTQGDNADGR